MATNEIVVTVTQEDRDAAADLSEQIAVKSNGLYQIALFRLGAQDATFLVQAFARHRIAAEQRVYERAREQAAEVAESHFDERPRRDAFEWNDGYQDGCKGAATAIRSMKDEGQ